MSGIWAVLPVKPPHASKTRLANVLPAAARAQLVHRLLIHTLSVLGDVPQLAGIWVVSSDKEVLSLAAAHGAALLPEIKPEGLNIAVSRGVNAAVAAEATGVLILPADLPFMRATDVTTMILTAGHHLIGQRGTEPGLMVICPDERQLGTNALLLLPPPIEFDFRYGENSFRQHLAVARAAGLASTIVSAAGLQFDLDTEADWQRYQLAINDRQKKGEFPCLKTA